MDAVVVVVNKFVKLIFLAMFCEGYSSLF